MDSSTQSPSASSPSTFANGTLLFVRILALAHAFAFGSLWLQVGGLIGKTGILPARDYFAAAYAQLGAKAWYEAPSLCWIFGADNFLYVLCALGLALSILLLFGYAQVLCLALLWVFYLSLASAGQIFFDFQWDSLLLECTLIALFLVPWRLGRARTPFNPPALARYLVWWLLFRLMFLSGMAKLTSGDPTWRNLTALSFHYQTQPLPSALAWYANLLPGWFQKASCAIMFVIEIIAPLCVPMPRVLRHAAALAMIALQLAIALTGSFAFFNLLSIGLCLTCLDDRWWRALHWGVPSFGPELSAPRHRAKILRWFAAFSVGITFFEFSAALLQTAAQSTVIRFLAESVGPFRSFNDYGLFAFMTIERPELVIEGSNDGHDWREYGLPYKPGELSRRPTWAAPHQPRLDWQLWFAALGRPDDNPWLGTLCEKLLSGEPAVTRLFSKNPFPDHPPRMMRVVRYRYEFTNAAERSATGNWWRRTPIDFYITPVSLSSN